MQTIIKSWDNAIQVFNDIEQLYADVSDGFTNKSLFDTVTYDESFRQLCEILYERVEWYDMPEFTTRSYPQTVVEENDHSVILCMSGGKDSVATALRLQELGYNVVLYHIHGINKVYPNEVDIVKDLAKRLRMPLFTDTVALCGKHGFVEHPMKNMIIANGALSLALKLGIPPVIAFGNFSDSHLEDNVFEVCGGDCVEMWKAYFDIVRQSLPTAEILLPLKNGGDTLRILGDNIDLVKSCISCVSPYRFRAHWKKRTEKKYGIKLWSNRCGGCWKCAAEYIYYADHDLVDFNAGYYLHCLDVLVNTVKKETGEKMRYADVWYLYMFYPISESKMSGVVFNGSLCSRKADSTK